MLDIIKTTFVVLKSDKRGVTAVEYAVIAGVLVAAVSTAFTTLGGAITTTLGNITFH